MSPERRLARRHERREGVIMIKVLPASTALQQQHFKSSCCCRRRIRKLHIAAAVDRKREQLAADRAQSKCQDNRLKYSCSQLNSLFEKSCFFLSFFLFLLSSKGAPPIGLRFLFFIFYFISYFLHQFKVVCWWPASNTFRFRQKNPQTIACPCPCPCLCTSVECIYLSICRLVQQQQSTGTNRRPTALAKRVLNSVRCIHSLFSFPPFLPLSLPPSVYLLMLLTYVQAKTGATTTSRLPPPPSPSPPSSSCAKAP